MSAPPLVRDSLETFLDDAGIGAGAIEATPIGDGHSNITYRLDRGGERVVLRRPPPGPLPPSAHDVLREARLLAALAPLGVRVPTVLATCDDPSVIGVPFYVMDHLDGVVLTNDAPPEAARAAIGEEVVAALAELHSVDAASPALAGFGRPGSYLERQVKRFGELLAHNATRPLPDLERLAAWLADNRPESQSTTVVHGDYRLGNLMVRDARVVALLDWELAAIGDPLADLGYLTATWASVRDEPNVMRELSPITRLRGFPDGAELARRYAELTGCSLDALPWYQALALWKSAIFLEGSYKRHLAGTTVDPFFAKLGRSVPALAKAALTLAHSSSPERARH